MESDSDSVNDHCSGVFETDSVNDHCSGVLEGVSESSSVTVCVGLFECWSQFV